MTKFVEERALNQKESWYFIRSVGSKGQSKDKVEGKSKGKNKGKDMTRAGRESKAVKDLPSITQVLQVLGEPKVKTAVTSSLLVLGKPKEDKPSIKKVSPKPVEEKKNRRVLSNFASAR